MAFVGPHQGPKILGKNHQSTTEVTLNEPPTKTFFENQNFLRISTVDHGYNAASKMLQNHFEVKCFKTL